MKILVIFLIVLFVGCGSSNEKNHINSSVGEEVINPVVFEVPIHYISGTRLQASSILDGPSMYIFPVKEVDCPRGTELGVGKCSVKAIISVQVNRIDRKESIDICMELEIPYKPVNSILKEGFFKDRNVVGKIKEFTPSRLDPEPRPNEGTYLICFENLFPPKKEKMYSLNIEYSY